MLPPRPPSMRIISSVRHCGEDEDRYCLAVAIYRPAIRGQSRHQCRMPARFVIAVLGAISSPPSQIRAIFFPVEALRRSSAGVAAAVSRRLPGAACSVSRSARGRLHVNTARFGAIVTAHRRGRLPPRGAAAGAARVLSAAGGFSACHCLHLFGETAARSRSIRHAQAAIREIDSHRSRHSSVGARCSFCRFQPSGILAAPPAISFFGSRCSTYMMPSTGISRRRESRPPAASRRKSRRADDRPTAASACSQQPPRLPRRALLHARSSRRRRYSHFGRIITVSFSGGAGGALRFSAGIIAKPVMPIFAAAADIAMMRACSGQSSEVLPRPPGSSGILPPRACWARVAGTHAPPAEERSASSPIARRL